MQMLNVSVNQCVQPVAMRSAVFCTVSSFVIFVVDAIDDHIVESYYSIRLVTASLYVFVCLVEEKTLSISIVLDTGVLSMFCYAYFSKIECLKRYQPLLTSMQQSKRCSCYLLATQERHYNIITHNKQKITPRF